MYSGNRKITLTVIFSILAVIVILGWTGFAMADKAAVLQNFDECAAAGNPVMESYPRRCTSANKTFTENIGNATALADEIRVTIPRPNQGVTFPFEITGTARGDWFAEGIFSVRLVDMFGRQIASSTANAQEEITGTGFVDFIAEFTPFATTMPERGVFIFTKSADVSDPTDLLVQLIVPVRLLAGSAVGEPEESTRIFTRRVALSSGDAIQFGDGLFLRLAKITNDHCSLDVRCRFEEEYTAQLELSGGALGASITDVALGVKLSPLLTLAGYEFEVLEADNDAIVLKVPGDLMATILHYRATVAQR